MSNLQNNDVIFKLTIKYKRVIIQGKFIYVSIFSTEELLSEVIDIEYNYIKQYEILHKQKPTYGMTSIKFYDDIEELIKKNNIKSILDYGCGKSKLIDRIMENYKVTTSKYDPAIEEYSNKPNSNYDLVICTDVLQHIPLFDLDKVLNNLKKYGELYFFHIRCTTYSTLLPNGEPANCTVHDQKWWKRKLNKYFENRNNKRN